MNEKQTLALKYLLEQISDVDDDNIYLIATLSDDYGTFVAVDVLYEYLKEQLAAHDIA